VVSQACVPFMIKAVEKQADVHESGGAGPCSEYCYRFGSSVLCRDQLTAWRL